MSILRRRITGRKNTQHSTQCQKTSANRKCYKSYMKGGGAHLLFHNDSRGPLTQKGSFIIWQEDLREQFLWMMNNISETIYESFEMFIIDKSQCRLHTNCIVRLVL